MGLRANLGSLAPAVPGELSSGDLTVENAGDQAADVHLSLTGEAAAWGWITPATMTVGALVVSVLTQLAGAALTVVFIVMLARIYVQLAGEGSAEASVPTSGTGRVAVRAICASMSRSYQWLTAPAPPDASLATLSELPATLDLLQVK